MSHLEEIAEVLDAWPALPRPRTPESLGAAGGFSGARFWKIQTPENAYCLRRWPREHPSPERLRTIHGVLAELAADCPVPVAAPLPMEGGETFLRIGGHLWEVSPWMQGRADFRHYPSPARLAAAMQALAQVHTVMARSRVLPPRLGRSPGLAQRAEKLEALLRPGEVERLQSALRIELWPEAAVSGRRLLELLAAPARAVLPKLQAAGQREYPLQACLRDIWHDHVFFKREVVSGLVDFGALREECPAGDVARLLGSLAGDDAERRSAGLAAYESVRPLSEEDRTLLGLFDRGTTLLGGVNWLTWIFVEQRRFEHLPSVLARLEEFLARAQFAAQETSAE